MLINFNQLHDEDDIDEDDDSHQTSRSLRRASSTGAPWQRLMNSKVDAGEVRREG